MRGVAVLGATGSIGRSALAVVERHRDRFRIVALTARQDADGLAALAAAWEPALVVLTDGEAGGRPGWVEGGEGLIAAATHPDVEIVLNAVVGAAGLEASLAALEAGKRLALANKESLVAGGPLVMEAARKGGGSLVPVDSEHSAILQCLPGGSAAGVRRMMLTASGGPFRSRPVEELMEVTPADALRHPTWDMGEKITVDSATLVNKALEIIEAHYLFDLSYDRLEAVIHPQSVIHSMVEFEDGSVLAQMGFPTMELPILYAFTHPERVADDGTRFDPLTAGPLTFERVDQARYPAFALGVAAGRRGGTAPAVYNAANEVAVAGFLGGGLRFVDIPVVIERTLEGCAVRSLDGLEAVREADTEARDRASEMIEELT
ncbi:MAG TPA: 1-deoxy-D-xylulose-5-phosphate reductoisomerase [Longimicrobiales bacterium]|nr:1-deoxy-D-xylulose-5-phosphate reductoisomerase [Longimicrobiales bacterium]